MYYCKLCYLHLICSFALQVQGPTKLLVSNYFSIIHFFTIFTLSPGVAMCTQHYCWGTQQTVKWRNCPSKILLPEEVFTENFRKKVFRKVSGKKLLPEEEFVTSGNTRKYFRKNVIRKFPEEPSFGSYLFLKKNYFVII